MGKFGWSYPPGCDGPPEPKSGMQNAILTMDEDSQIRDKIASMAGEEQIIERTRGGHVGQIEVELSGRPLLVTIVVEGRWEDDDCEWWIESVCYA